MAGTECPEGKCRVAMRRDGGPPRCCGGVGRNAKPYRFCLADARPSVRPSVRRSVPPRGGGGGPHGTSPGPGRSPLVGSPACRRPSGVGRRRREDTYVEATVPGPDEHFARLSVRYQIRYDTRCAQRLSLPHGYSNYTHTHTRLTALFRDYPDEQVPER